jgi:hypothetical protein
MNDDFEEPGPLVPEKLSDDSGPGRPEPDAEEVESARLLANTARDRLRSEGLDDEEIRRLADAYVALDLGEDTEDFIAWARDHRDTAT